MFHAADAVEARNLPPTLRSPANFAGDVDRQDRVERSPTPGKLWGLDAKEILEHQIFKLFG